MGVFGSCGGGLSVLTSVSDFALMTKDAKLFVNSADAISGNRADKLDTASADFQYAEAGNVDFVGDEAEVMEEIRRFVTILPGCNVEEGCVEECMDDLNRAAEGLDGKVKNLALLQRRSQTIISLLRPRLDLKRNAYRFYQVKRYYRWRGRQP